MALILNFLAVWIGAVLTYTLNVDYKQGAVRSSALVGVFIGLIYLVLPDLFASPIAKDILMLCLEEVLLEWFLPKSIFIK